MTDLEQELGNAENELLTIRDFLRFGVSLFTKAELFYGHGTDNAWDEAINLMLYALHLPDLQERYLDAQITTQEKKKIISIFKQRVLQRIPAAYITKNAYFAGLNFYVDERVLVPRSPIAELIEAQFEPWIELEAVSTILDLCTGSACIAIACAERFPDADIDAVDISAQALEVAKINVENYHLESQVNLIQSDLFQNLQGRRYDVIVSNPPYVDSEDMDSLPEEYLAEPALGLAAGTDGLDIVIRILQQASDYLTEEGVLIIEVGNSHRALVKRFPSVPFHWFDFERGGHGVFALSADELAIYRDYFYDE